MAPIETRDTQSAEELEAEERLRRLAADCENLRRRHERELASVRQEERAAVISELLPLVDSLDRARDCGPLDPSELARGLQALRQQAGCVLERLGATRMETVGEPFDPTVHEAIATEPGAPEGIVLQEVAAGYLLGTAVLRPARVVVSGGLAGGAE